MNIFEHGFDVRVMLAIVEKEGATNVNGYSDVRINVYVILVLSIILFSCKDTRRMVIEEWH